MVHVPFTGGQAALTAVLSKSVDMHFGNSSDLIEPVKSGNVKALAVSTPQRMPQLPDVPTVAETIPGFEYIAWNGYAVTGGVPPEVAGRLAEALRTVAGEPDVVKTFANLGIQSVGSTPEQATDSIRQGYADLLPNRRYGRCAAQITPGIIENFNKPVNITIAYESRDGFPNMVNFPNQDG